MPAPMSKSGGMLAGVRPVMSNSPKSARAAADWLASEPLQASMYACTSGKDVTK